MPPHKGMALVKTDDRGSGRWKRVINISSLLISSGRSMVHWISKTDPGTGNGRRRSSPALKSITETKATLKCHFSHDWFIQSVQSTAVAFPFTDVQLKRESTAAVLAAESAAGAFNSSTQCVPQRDGNEGKITKYITFLKLTHPTEYNLLAE